MDMEIGCEVRFPSTEWGKVWAPEKFVKIVSWTPHTSWDLLNYYITLAYFLSCNLSLSGWRFEPLPAVPWHVTLLTKPPLPFLYLCVNQNYRSYEVTTTTFSFELVYSDCEFSIINLNGGSHKIMSMSLKWKKSILTCSAMNHEKLLVGELLSLGGHIACLIATQVIPRGWQTKIPEHLKIVNSFPLMKGV